MNASSPSARSGQRARIWAGTVAAAGVVLILTACQTPSVDDDRITEPAPRTAPARPAGIDLGRPADRIDEALQRMDAARQTRETGRPADRIEEQLSRERDAAAGRVPGCIHHVFVAAPRGEEALVCVEPHD
jgi:hypothetical protein